MTSAKIGVVGLGVMGLALAQNFSDNGILPIVYDLDALKRKSAAELGLTAADSLDELCGGLDKPAVVFVMVPAGDAAEGAIKAVLSHMHKGDVIIDGGNTYWRDTIRRQKMAGEKGVMFGRLVNCQHL